jgi:cyclic-di-GMP-binding protein
MPSFDIESKVDGQQLDNAINNLKKEILTRFDFQGSTTTIELDKKTNIITIVTENSMKIDQVQDVLISKLLKQSIDPRCLDGSKEQYASGDKLRKEITVKSGIDKETAKKIIKLIKESRLKVTAQINDDQVRVTGKKLDDLQSVIEMVKSADLGMGFQFLNMRA